MLRFFAAKYSPGGSVKWKNTLAGRGSAKSNFARTIVVTSGGAYPAGVVSRTSRGRDAALIKYKL